MIASRRAYELLGQGAGREAPGGLAFVGLARSSLRLPPGKIPGPMRGAQDRRPGVKSMRCRAMAAGLMMTAAAMAAPAALAQDQAPLRIALDGELQILDPVVTSAYLTRNFSLMVFDTLIAQDADGAYRPQMLESWQVSEDRLTYSFTLREGLEWHDGAPVTAEDCVASIRRWAARDGMGRLMMAAAGELRVLDQRRFVLQLARPFGFVIEALGKASSNLPAMMPARLAATDPTRAIPEVIGSGPYRFVPSEYRAGDRAVFARNPRYRPRAEPASGLAGGKVVHFARAEFVSIPDTATKVAALQRGEVDFVQRVPFDYLAQLRRDPNIRIPSGRGVPQFMGVVQVNQAQPPFDNPLLRQAVQQLMDQPEYLAALGLPADMFLPWCLSIYTCSSPYASEAGAERLGDPSLERARALMRQAGYAGQPVVLLQSADVPIINTVSLVTIDRMQRAGFNVQVRSTDWSSIAQQRWNRNPPGSGGWSVLPLIWAAEDLTTPLSNYPIANNCRNYPGWACDEAINDLLVRFGAESDLEKRREIAAQIQARAHESVSLSLAGQFAVPPAYRANLTGMIAAEVPVFWNVRREGR